MTRSTKSALIKIEGARQNNLAGVNVELPRGSLIAITGVSGSGKSSLAFDTLFREGQRRFLETLSAYARQFLGQMQKPDVEVIEGLSPAIAVDQKTIARGRRSTVGTLTEIVDHLRVLFARAGQAHCPGCDLPIESRTPEAVVQEILRDHDGEKLQLLAPVIRDRKGHHRPAFDSLRRKGFVRARVDGEIVRLEDAPELERYKRHSIEVVVDRLKPDAAEPARLREAIDQALAIGDGDVIVLTASAERLYSTLRTCPGCDAETPPLEPRLFSFNSPHGACPTCEGLGELRQPSTSAVVRDPRLSIRAGALAVTRASGGALLFPRADFEFLAKVGESHDFDLDTPWKDLSKKGRRAVLRGTGEERFADTASWSGARYQGSVKWKRRYRGVLPALDRAQAKGSRRKMVERFLTLSTCPECEGSRLRSAAQAVRLAGVRMRQLTDLPVQELAAKLKKLKLDKRQKRIARDLITEIDRRADFLMRVGLGYLTLDRSADSLSGGEAQRIRLAAQLGAGLQGVLYVLDEPSIGLHYRDHDRLLGALDHLVDVGNSVVVVEHDEATLRAADWIVDVGPGAGKGGGHIVAEGSPDVVSKADTPTGRLLRGEIEIERPESRRTGNGDELVIRGARAFNLKEVDASLPLGTLTVVSGVSGSGKSTLIDRTLRRAIVRHLGRETADPGDHDVIDGLKAIDEMVCIDAAPIGRTTRSNPATYTKVLGPIRELFAQLPESRVRGYTKSRFSFNVAGGRCEACCGGGANYVELQFLAPVTVPCEECGGHRFQAETLDVQYKGHSIADVLAMTASEALELFGDHPKISRQLNWMVEIGLGYLTLGQPSTTISGGEAQRLKLVTHLSKRPSGHTLYLLDEPTTGLHMEDVGRLVAAFQRLVDMGHTVIVIEHNLELIQAADHVIDLGPEGGAKGGHIIAAGTPEVIAKSKRSHTGEALRELEKVRKKPTKKRVRDGAKECTEIRVEGARTHNLNNIDVSIPRDALTVVTGPSGSGKSSLALDTIYTEGRRRFVESLSTYARQFLGTKDKPPVERITGLGPSVAVEARTVSGHPRSTVSTTTEIHDHLRVLWSRAGTPRCPTHGEKLERGDAAAVTRAVLKALSGKKGWLVAPIVGHGMPVPADIANALADRLAAWRTAGYVRLLVDGAEVRLDADEPEWLHVQSVDLVLDRLSFDSSDRARIAEAVEGAAAVAHGRVSAIEKVGTGEGERFEFSTNGACTQCGFQLESAIEPRHMSFNTHVGACDVCDGLGKEVRCSAELLVSDESLSFVEGAIDGKLGRYLTKGKGYYEMLLRTVARLHKISIQKPVANLTDAERALLLFGDGAREQYKVTKDRSSENLEIHESFTASWPGLCGQVDAWHKKTDDPEWATVLETVMRREVCTNCKGERLKPEYRAVTLGRRRLPELLSMNVTEALAWLNGLKLKAAARTAVEPVISELTSRLALLEQVGLGYVTLDRSTATLSGGEARRVRLSASLGSQLVGVCYVLDEPTVGLHPRDVDQLTDALCELRDRGNTVLVVEHDGTLMKRADWIIDMGPGAGIFGGNVVVAGTPKTVAAHKDSLTGAYLRGDVRLEEARGDLGGGPTHRRKIQLEGARTHNLKSLDFEVEFGRMTGVCGPSGSGKSTLVLDTLVPALEGERSEGRWERCTGMQGGTRVVVVDASPIGRTPHSVPATYVGLMNPVRELFSRTPDARFRGYGISNFSFNSTKGRCPACEGKGATLVEMQFLADLWLTCEECDGRRYQPEVLEVRFRGKTIADVLEMSVDEACEFFAHQPKASVILGSLRDVGLGYLRLGQSSTTLSGGEAQRVKLASELMRAKEGMRSVVVLDEPSTGLAASDTVHLARVLGRLARNGNAVVVIEHHTELLAICDGLVELGPDGGEAGGRIIAEGTPVELAENPDSITGPWLKQALFGPGSPQKKSKARAKRKKVPGAS